jgi:uncharacterized membrane protein
MQENFMNIFIEHMGIIIFIHVLSAIIWVGGMISTRFTVYSTLKDVQDHNVKFKKTLKIMKKQQIMTIPFVILLILTSIVMTLGINFKGTQIYNIIHIKESIWLFMALNFFAIYQTTTKAQKLIHDHDILKAREQLAIINKLLLPINIILGIIALYLGVILRGY